MIRARLPQVLAACFIAASLVPVSGQSGTGQTASLEINVLPTGRVQNALQLATTPGRHPVVLLVSDRASSLVRPLAEEGVASLRLIGPVDENSLAQAIAVLRNDERFPTVTVFAEGAAVAAGVIAARAARADGVITRGPASEAAVELARVVATKLHLDSDDVADLTTRIAAFARTVPVLGRRGSSATRPTTARRSPRQVLLASIGAVRIGIEWGQPQKRGREIWGSLVKWNDIWMPGADEATAMTTSGPLTIGTLDVPAGDHTLYLFPSPEKVELVVSTDVGQFHTVHDASKELGRIVLTPSTRAEALEGLTFTVKADASGSAGALTVGWDTREYSTQVRSQK